jgi:hypothetical protein
MSCASTRALAARARARRDELRRFEPVSDAVVLAAAERAERHHRAPADGVTLGEVIEHLGFARVGWTTRSLRPQIDAFLATGALVPFRRFKIDFLKLTPAGRRRLAQARRGKEVVLPESPQHREWRHARQQATERVSAMRQLFGKPSMKPTGCSATSKPTPMRGTRSRPAFTRPAASWGRSHTAHGSGPSRTTPTPTTTASPPAATAASAAASSASGGTKTSWTRSTPGSQRRDRFPHLFLPGHSASATSAVMPVVRVRHQGSSLPSRVTIA